MYRRQIEEYLTHYQPELKAELLKEEMFQTYLDDKAQAMQTAKQEILERMTTEMSQLQRELEADQLVREIFLPV